MNCVAVLPLTELDARGRRLRAVLVPDNAPELRLVREWLDNWSGLGLIIDGMTRVVRRWVSSAMPLPI